MTEKEIYTLQNDIFFWLESKMGDIPPLLQKMIIEGIYSRYQTKAAAYNWELEINDKINNNQEKEQDINEQNQKTES